MKISAIIPVYNGGENFIRCLHSLSTANPQPFEIIVVANGDDDGSALAAQEHGVKVLAMPERCGPAQARNLGAQMAVGDIFYFVDADVRVPVDVFQRISSIFTDEPELAALIGSYDDEPGAANFVSQYKNLLHHYVHQSGNIEAATFWGACGAIRKEIFLDLGGFNPVYDRPAIEDIELGYRIRKAGYQIRLLKGLQVQHLKRWTPTSLIKTDIFDRAIPWTRINLQNRVFPSELNLNWSNRISVVLIFTLFLVLIGSFWLPRLSIAAGVAAVLLVVINFAVYRFFLDKRGIFFTLCVLPWHWLYYFYSGLGFLVGLIAHISCQMTNKRG